MENNTITVSELMQKYNFSRTTIQNYLLRDEEFNNCSKIVFGKRLFDTNKLNEWYKNKVTI